MGFMPLRIGILGQALAPLALGTMAVTVLAMVGIYSQVAIQRRDEALRDILHDATARYDHEQVLFAQVNHQIIHCRRLLEERLALGLPIRHAISRTSDGSRRLLPAAGQAPLAAFITAPTVDDALQIRAAGLAADLVAELGPAWTAYPSNLTITIPGRWLVGWGADPVALVETLLPDDPLLLPAERELLSVPGAVRWSRTFLEPASERWLIAAGATVDIPDLGRVLITQVVPADTILARVSQGQEIVQDTVVFDSADRMLAHNRLGKAIRAAGGELTLALSGDPLLMRLRSVIPSDSAEAVALVVDPAGQGWFGVSRYPEPGWTTVTFHPAEIVQLQASAAARSVLYIGLLLLVAQTFLLIGVLRWRVSRPLRRLVSATAELAAGRPGPILDPTRQDEIGELSAAFAAMSQAVAQREAELHQALKHLREREEHARALVASAADAVLLLVDGRVAEANPRAGSLFGCAETALLGLTLGELSPKQQADGSPTAAGLAKHLAALADSGSVHFPWRHQRRDATEFEAEIGLAQVALPGPERLLAVIRDVTERNRLQERLRQGEKMESLGQLAGGIAHDFNNMLTGILGSAQLIKICPPGSAKIQSYADIIITTSMRSADLTRTLLTFARKGRASSTRIDVHQILKEARQLLERSIDKRIRITVRPAAESAWIKGDAAQLQNALINLALNARDAMPEGGDLFLTTTNCTLDETQAARLTPTITAGHYLEIVVQDTGSGIPLAILPRIFEPFFTTKVQGKGTGIGLASVYGTVQNHRGAIQVESRPGAGSTFRLWLPQATTDLPTTGVQSRPAPGPRVGTILVVDDEAVIRANARAMLGAVGWDVLEACDGVEAVEIFTREQARISATLIDMEMPRMRGIDCLREMKRLNPHVVAVLCTGYIREGSEGDMLEAGFHSVLAKPYLPDDLIHALDKALAKRNPSL